MAEFNIKGSVVSLLFTAIEKNPDMTIGEILYTSLSKKSLGKNIVQASDDEVYTALEKFVKYPEEEDEQCTEEEFNSWIANK